MMSDSQATAIIHGPQFSDTAEDICQAVPGVKLQGSARRPARELAYEEVAGRRRRR